MQRLNVLIGFILAALVLVVSHFVFHVPEGTGRLLVFALAAVVFCLAAFAWKPRES